MALALGTRLGAYEIVSLLGSGGMGEVYKARDTRLDRNVAVKILAAAVAADPHFRERFNREARAISQLAHPHICTLHDVGEHEGTAFLVMELLTGETLAERLTKGALPLDEALRVAIEITGALDAAHRHGIVHRDLKPGNVMLTKGGAKLLDFGLAKASAPAIAGVETSMLPTRQANLTEPKTILGTVQYMAPEQLEGLDADARTDLFALGAVLYEMLTGRKAFEGRTHATLIAAIIGTNPPPLSQILPIVPATLDRIVATCLAKEPDERWQSARDLTRELRWVAEPSTSVDGHPSQARSIWLRALPWTVAGVFGVALVAAVLAWSSSRVTSNPTRLTLSLSRDISLTIGGGIAISPDGATVAFVGNTSQGSSLYVRRLDEWEPHALPATDGATRPFFSPDGRWIAFQRSGRLEKIPASGGASQTLFKSSVGEILGGRWHSNGAIVFGTSPAGLWRVSADGGTPHLITRPIEDGGTDYRSPELLPGDWGVLFTLRRGDGRSSIAALAPGTDTPRILVESAAGPRYLATGHLVYVANNHLFAVPFDIQRLAVRGPATIVGDDVNEALLAADYDVSVNGSLVYLPTGSSASNIVWRDRQGATVPITTVPRNYLSLALSQDGGRLSVNVVDGSTRNIWTGSVANGLLTRLTSGDSDVFGLWSRDGSRLFYSNGQSNFNIFWIATDGSGKTERLTKSSHRQAAWSLSPGGDTILFNDIDPSTGTDSTGNDIWALSVSSKESRPVVKTRFDEAGAVFSPDGRWIAYHSDESTVPTSTKKQFEVYVQPYPGPGAKQQASREGGKWPYWSHSGHELFYLTDTAVFAVAIQATDDLRMGTPMRLFARTGGNQGVGYATSPDDQRFVIVEKAGSQSSQLRLVQNWSEELKARVPTK
jgi:serine/threonine protein kinase